MSAPKTLNAKPFEHPQVIWLDEEILLDFEEMGSQEQTEGQYLGLWVFRFRVCRQLGGTSERPRSKKRGIGL